MRAPFDVMQGRSRRASAGAVPARARRACRGVLLAALAGVSPGCYTYAPRSADVTPGTRVALDINDVGRVALASGLGAGAERVEGSVVSQTDSALHLRVTSVRYRGGVATRWSGEPLEVQRAHVSETRERRFSRARSLALAAIVVGVIATLALSSDFDIFGIAGGDGDPGDGPDQ